MGKKQGMNRGFDYSDSYEDTSYNTTSSGTDALNRPILIISVIAGVVFWFICFLLYRNLLERIPRALLIGILFAVLSAGVCLTINVVSRKGGDYKGDILSGGTEKIILFAGTLVIFGAAVLFQWIYGLNLSHRVDKPTAYIFVMDDSGSMSSNDPSFERYTSIQTVMEGMPADFPYMVYGFSDEAYVIRDMNPPKPDESYNVQSHGGTNIKGALERVLQDYDTGVWTGGSNPKVLLLSDGESNGAMNKLLKDYARKGISISTVGFGAVNSKLMQKIATNIVIPLLFIMFFSNSLFSRILFNVSSVVVGKALSVE